MILDALYTQCRVLLRGLPGDTRRVIFVARIMGYVPPQMGK